MRSVDSITDAMNMNLGKLQENTKSPTAQVSLYSSFLML